LYPLERLWGVIYVWHTEELDSIAAGAVSAWAEEKLSHFGLARRVSDSLHQLCGILLLYIWSSKQTKMAAKKLAAKQAEAELRAKSMENVIASGWFSKSRRSKGKSVAKSKDDRFFWVVNENGNANLTWAKNDNPTTMAKTEARYRVDEITAVWTGQRADAKREMAPIDDPTTFASRFNLLLPPDSGAAAERKAEKLAAKVARSATKDPRTVFDELDADGSGFLDISEVAILTRALGKKLNRKGLSAALAEMDQNADGQIGFDEFDKWWQANGGKALRSAAYERAPEPEADDAEEGEPPEDEAPDEEADVVDNVEIGAQKADKAGTELYKFVVSLLQAGADIEGGADKKFSSGSKKVTVLMDGMRDAGIQFKLDEQNCLTDFKGPLLSVKGISIGLKLSNINNIPTFGWPPWMVWSRLNDPDTDWPMSCGFVTCSDTLAVDSEDTGEGRVSGKVAIVVGGGKGIGFELANVLVREGADVCLFGRNLRSLESAQAQLVGLHYGSEAKMLQAERTVKIYQVDACR
jgi:hypothetical protein